VARKATVVELPLTPGALSDDTDLAAKLYAVNTDKVRSRGGRWETIKGWEEFDPDGMTAGTARGLHTFADLDGTPVVVAASESAINAWIEGNRLDITPPWKDVWLGTGALTNGSTTTEMIVTWVIYSPVTDTTAAASLHHLNVGDEVTFSGVVNVDSGAEVMNTTYTITSVTPTTFTITVGDTANISVTKPFVATVAFREGLATGTGDMISERARIWSIDNFGENAVFVGSDGTPIWYWEPARSFPELVTSGGFGASTGWTLGTGWAIAGGVATHTGTSIGTLSQAVNGVLEGGKTYEMSFTLTTIQADIDVFKVQIDSIDIFPPTFTGALGTPAQQTYTFRFVCPPEPALLMIIADSSGATDDLVIDNVSIKQLSRAHPLNEGPQKNYALFVDGNHVISVLGSVEQDGDFNPLLLRWSAQDNPREWITDTDNIAGELTLGKGSYAVCGAQVGERNLILSDDAAYVASFTSNGYSLQLIGTGCGAIGPRSMAVHNNRAFWASHSGFHIYDGAQVLPVECPIKDRYVDRLKEFQDNKTFAWLNSEFGEVWFHYPHTDDGNEISRFFIYNFLEQGNPWAFGTFNRTCFVRSSVFDHPIAIDVDGNIWYHETGNEFSGEAINLPFIETGFITSQSGNKWTGCRRFYPDIENQTGNIEFSVTGKRAPQGALNTQVVGPFVIAPGDRKVDFLISARQLKFRWESTDTPTQWRLGVVGLEVIAERERR
jgi:hypothetical protein